MTDFIVDQLNRIIKENLRLTKATGIPTFIKIGEKPATSLKPSGCLLTFGTNLPTTNELGKFYHWCRISGNLRFGRNYSEGVEVIGRHHDQERVKVFEAFISHTLGPREESQHGSEANSEMFKFLFGLWYEGYIRTMLRAGFSLKTAVKVEIDGLFSIIDDSDASSKSTFFEMLVLSNPHFARLNKNCTGLYDLVMAMATPIAPKPVKETTDKSLSLSHDRYNEIKEYQDKIVERCGSRGGLEVIPYKKCEKAFTIKGETHGGPFTVGLFLDPRVEKGKVELHHRSGSPVIKVSPENDILFVLSNLSMVFESFEKYRHKEK